MKTKIASVLTVLFVLFVALPMKAADAYFGTKASITSMHDMTNYFILVMGDGTNAVIRKLNPTNALEILRAQANYGKFHSITNDGPTMLTGPVSTYSFLTNYIGIVVRGSGNAGFSSFNSAATEFITMTYPGGGFYSSSDGPAFQIGPAILNVWQWSTNGNRSLVSLFVDDTNVVTHLKLNGGQTNNAAAIIQNDTNVVGHPTVSVDEITYLDGVTSPLQAQIDAKASTATVNTKLNTNSGTAFLLTVRGANFPTLTAARPAFIDSSGNITNASGTPDGTKFMRDDGVLAVPPGGGGGTPGGATPMIQMNMGGAFVGTTNLTYDVTNSRVGLNLPGGERPGFDFDIGGTAPTIRMRSTTLGASNNFSPTGMVFTTTGFNLPGIYLISDVQQQYFFNTNTLYTLNTNRTDFGTRDFPWRSNYNKIVSALVGYQIGEDANAYSFWRLTNSVKSTNVYWMAGTNWQAGQYWKVHSVTYAGAVANVVMTNDFRTIAGTANEVSVANGTGVGGDTTIALPATIDLGGKTSFELPNGSAPTTDAFGEIAGDNNAWGSNHGAIQFYDGTLSTFVIAVDSSDSPNNGDVPRFNSASGTFTLEASSGDVSAASTFGTDNILIRSDGTAKGVQGSGVVVSDTTNVTAIQTLGAVAGNFSGALAANSLTVTGAVVTLGGSAGSLILSENSAVKSIKISAPATLSSNINITLPQAISNGFWRFTAQNDSNYVVESFGDTGSGRVVRSVSPDFTGTADFDTVIVTNQIIYVPQEYNGSNGTSAITLTNTLDLSLNAFKSVTNVVGTNLTYILTNLTKGVPVVLVMKGNGSYSNNVAFIVASAGTNIVWCNWGTNGTYDIQVRPNFTYMVSLFADKQSNVVASVITDDIYVPVSAINIFARFGLSSSNVAVAGRSMQDFTAYTNHSSTLNFTNIGSTTLPAHGLTNRGDSITYTFQGRMQNAAASTNEFILSYGSQTNVLDTGLQTASNTAYKATITITKIDTAGSLQLVDTRFEWGLVNSGVTGVPFSQTNNSVIVAETNGVDTTVRLQHASRRIFALTNEAIIGNYQKAR